MDSRRRRLLLALGAATAVGLAGCSGESNSGDDDTASQTTSTGTASGEPAEPTTGPPDPSTEQTAKLRADESDATDMFGTVVELSGDGATALVGSLGEEVSDGEWEEPVVYVFRLSDGNWTRESRLVPSDRRDAEAFGESVAVNEDGTTVLVGAPEVGISDSVTGTAYVFSRSGREWSQAAELRTENADDSLNVGQSVSLSADGSTALVGTPRDGSNIDGAAHVFSRSDGEWSHSQKLVADDTDSNDNLGMSVALSGDAATAIIAAPNHEPSGTDKQGAAYTFTREEGEWTQQAKLTADESHELDEFAQALDLAADGSTVVVGAPDSTSASEESPGAVYVYSRADGEWTQQSRLTPPGDAGQVNFGSTVGISGDGRVAIFGVTGLNNGAYLFSQLDGDWSQETTLGGDGGLNAYFGHTVSLADSGSRAIIGAAGEEDSEREGSGAAYVFE